MAKYAMFLPIIFMVLSCGNGNQPATTATSHDSATKEVTTVTATDTAAKQSVPQAAPAAGGAAFTGTQVPILCYHQRLPHHIA
jgi:hypothetical protein